MLPMLIGHAIWLLFVIAAAYGDYKARTPMLVPRVMGRRLGPV